jgi:hypothetical protein
MTETIESIITASELPISILIIGVGDADFTNMNILDGDKTILKSRINNKQVKRDIVQFVAMKDFNDLEGIIYENTIAKALLEEIPGQVVEYYQVS